MSRKFLANIITLTLCILTSCRNTNDSPLALIPVCENGKCGYIDLEGNYVISPQFDDADFFYENVAMVNCGGRMGYINTKGEYIIQPQYECGTYFWNGRAFVMKDSESIIECIDINGSRLFDLPWDWSIQAFSNERAFFRDENGRVGFLNTEGILYGEPTFDNGMPFSEGLAAIQNHGFWGFIDKNEKVIIPFRFRNVTFFHEGLAGATEGSLWGVINKKGDWVVTPQFDSMGEFWNGRCAVKIGDAWGYINEIGKIIIEPKFLGAINFSNGLACICLDDKWGFIDENGTIIITPQYDYPVSFYDEVAFVEKDGMMGIIDKSGNVLCDFRFNRTELILYSSQIPF